MSFGGCARSSPCPLPKRGDARLHDFGLLDRRHVGSARHDEELRAGDLRRHRFRQERRRERVPLSSDHERRHFDVGQEALGAVLAGGAQHAEEHAGLDVRHLAEVRNHVLGADLRRVEVTGLDGDLERHLGGNARPERAQSRRAPGRDLDDLRQHPIHDGHAFDGARDLAVAPAHEDEPTHFVGVAVCAFERDLAAHRVTDEDARRIADVPSHGHQVVGVRADVDPIRILGHRAPPVPPVVPVDERRVGRHRLPQVLPDEALAGNAVTKKARTAWSGCAPICVRTKSRVPSTPSAKE
ncbi:MAG: hypothetical protein U0235_31325 [Polyangiaceae bacterium]